MEKLYCLYTCRNLYLSWKFTHYRSIFSVTKCWDEKLTTDLKIKIEDYWRKHVQSVKTEDGDSIGEKMYILSMFPYPSGKLHMGHIRVYTTSDTLARYYRLLGKNVIHPIGWDSFGLPAENAANQQGVLPDKWTYDNISHMKKQLRMLGCSFDWDREISTCHPKYYKWTQYIFLKLFERGLAYQNTALVNWDPVDKTVLADEQVDELGCSWRSGAKVEKKLLKQWFLRTSKLAKSLADGLDDPSLIDWEDITKIQKNWIGDCNGWRFEFNLQHKGEKLDQHIPTWTQTPEMIFGAAFIAVKSGHYLNKLNIEGSNSDTQLEVAAIHPITGELLPILISNDVDFPPDSEVHIGIPCYNAKDQALATKFHLNVIDVTDRKSNTLINSGQFSGLDLIAARKAICDYAKKNNFGGYQTSSSRHDWLISRQRYWGTPFPIIHCPKCKTIPVPYDQLPVVLPKIEKKQEAQEMLSPLTQISEWTNVTCPKCSGPASRETDTMDTFCDSAWYFLRYLDPRNERALFNRNKANAFMPVDLYIGGKEHALLHLFSARFVHHFLRDEGFVECREPFRRLLMMGMITSESYKVKTTGRYLSKDEIEITGTKVVEKSTGNPVTVQWEKMSKSKFNGVDPQELIDKYGVDTVRLFVLANCPPSTQRKWDLRTIVGILHWQSRLWYLVHDFLSNKLTSTANLEVKKYHSELFENRNFCTKKVTHALDHTHSLNVAISILQRLTNGLRKYPRNKIGNCQEYENSLAALIIMLSPFAPHFASELWAGFSTSPNLLHPRVGSVWTQQWPQVDLDYCVDLVIKINGKDVSTQKVPRKEMDELTENDAIRRTESIVATYLTNKIIDRINFKRFVAYDGEIDYIPQLTKNNQLPVNQELTERSDSLLK